MDIRGLVGKRILMSAGSYYNSNNVEEYKVLEVSPSGNWVKVMNNNTRKFWKMVSACALVEVLEDLEASPKE